MDGSTSSDGATSATIDRPQINNFPSPSEGSGDSRARQSQFVIAQCRRNTSTEVSAAPNASTNNENTEDSDTEDRILSVYWRAGKLGAAHYTIQTGEQIWCVAPCTRCLKIYLASVRTIVQACMSACVVPVAEAVGHLCRHIRVNFRKDSPEEKDMLIV